MSGIENFPPDFEEETGYAGESCEADRQEKSRREACDMSAVSGYDPSDSRGGASSGIRDGAPGAEIPWETAGEAPEDLYEDDFDNPLNVGQVPELAGREAFENEDAGRRPGRSFREFLIRRAMEKDLARVRRVYPDAASLEEAGPVYAALRFSPVAPMDPARAYGAAMTVAAGGIAKKPPSAGSISAGRPAVSDYYTSRELDRLTRERLKDPAVYRKAMRSLSKL